MELIKVKTNNKGQQLVSARELYIGLGLDKSQWSRWQKKNIVNNEFFTENVDWMGVRLNVEGNLTMDFAISIEFAKHIAMMARTEKSHEYRQYFIECEKKLKEVQQPKLPQTYLEALEALVESEKVKLQQAKQLEEQKPKVLAYDKFMDSDGLYTVTNASKMLGLKVRKEVYPWLRSKNWILRDNKPSTRGIESGYFKLIASGEYLLTKITPKGIEMLRENIDKIKGDF